MARESVDAVLKAQDRTWAWLGRQIGTTKHRIWRLSRGEVPWRHQEATATAEVLGVPYAALFGYGADVLPAGRERAPAAARTGQAPDRGAVA